MKLLIALILVALAGLGAMVYVSHETTSTVVHFSGNAIRAPRKLTTHPAPKPAPRKPTEIYKTYETTTYETTQVPADYDYWTNKIQKLEQQICTLTEQLPSTPELEKIKTDNNCY